MIMAFLRKLFGKKKVERPQIIPVEEPKKVEPIQIETPEPVAPDIDPIPVPADPDATVDPIPDDPDIGEIPDDDEEEEQSTFKEGPTPYPEGIKDYETKFDTTKKDSDGVKYDIEYSTAFPFPLAILKPQGVTDFFYPEETHKSAITLHFTVGFLTGDIGTLIDQGSHVSVPFVIGRNGTVYQLFNSKYWAYHLGRGTLGGNTAGSRRTIGIELSNIGPLSRHDGELRNIYGSKYCTVAEKDFYTKMNSSYRKYSYFASFTEEQYDSLSKLITYLCSKHNIPRKFLSPERRYSLFSSKDIAETYEGVCSHVNFRADGKVDIGPAFDWNKIIDV